MFTKQKDFLACSVLLVLLPAIPVGVRSFYFFEIFWIALFFIAICGLIKVSEDLIQGYLVILFLVFVLLFLQVVNWDAVLSMSSIRFLLICLPLIFYNKINFLLFTRLLCFISYYVALLALFQFLDGYLLSNTFGVNRFVGWLYPYTGYLSDYNLSLSGGAHIGVNSFSSATTIADGQTILAGNLLAILSVYALYQRRYFLFSLSFLAILITFSRGSWLMVLVGVVGVFLSSSGRSKKNITLVFVVVLVLIVAIAFLNESVYQAFHYRIMNTLYVFGFSDYDVGSNIDPRTETVWPAFIAALRGAGIGAFLVGLPYDGPTDSGYLAIIRESGFIGILAYILLFVFVLVKSKFDRLTSIMLVVVAVGMVFNPVHQGYRLMFIMAMIFASRIFYVNQKKTSYD